MEGVGVGVGGLFIFTQINHCNKPFWKLRKNRSNPSPESVNGYHPEECDPAQRLPHPNELQRELALAALGGTKTTPTWWPCWTPRVECWRCWMRSLLLILFLKVFGKNGRVWRVFGFFAESIAKGSSGKSFGNLHLLTCTRKAFKK